MDRDIPELPKHARADGELARLQLQNKAFHQLTRKASRTDVSRYAVPSWGRIKTHPTEQ